MIGSRLDIAARLPAEGCPVCEVARSMRECANCGDYADHIECEHYEDACPIEVSSEYIGRVLTCLECERDLRAEGWRGYDD